MSETGAAEKTLPEERDCVIVWTIGEEYHTTCMKADTAWLSRPDAEKAYRLLKELPWRFTGTDTGTILREIEAGGVDFEVIAILAGPGIEIVHPKAGDGKR